MRLCPYASLWHFCFYYWFQVFHFVFQTFRLFFPKIPASFASYIVQIISIFHLDSVIIAIYPASFDLTILNILHQTTVYAASTHNYLDSMWRNILLYFRKLYWFSHQHHHHHHNYYPNFPNLKKLFDILNWYSSSISTTFNFLALKCPM